MVLLHVESVKQIIRSAIFCHLVDLLVPCWRSLDFEGVPKSTTFENILTDDLQEGGLKKQTFVNNYTAKVGEAKHIDKRLADGLLLFLGIPFGGHWISEGPSARCLSMYLALPINENHVFVDSCAANIGTLKQGKR